MEVCILRPYCVLSLLYIDWNQDIVCIYKMDTKLPPENHQKTIIYRLMMQNHRYNTFAGFEFWATFGGKMGVATKLNQKVVPLRGP